MIIHTTHCTHNRNMPSSKHVILVQVLYTQILRTQLFRFQIHYFDTILVTEIFGICIIKRDLFLLKQEFPVAMLEVYTN